MPDRGTSDDNRELQRAGLTDPGQRRERNEDALGWRPAASTAEAHLAIVADGVGGSAAGDAASRLAVETIERLFAAADGWHDDAHALREAFAAANRAILAAAQADPAKHGMATTCTAVAFRAAAVTIAHVGDCRAYLVADGDLKQLTVDHSLAQDYEEQGLPLPPEKKNLANVLTRWLGREGKGEPDLIEMPPLAAGASLVICSDGLTKVVEDREILDSVSAENPDTACRRLIDLANERGGPDNITVQIVRRAG